MIYVLRVPCGGTVDIMVPVPLFKQCDEHRSTEKLVWVEKDFPVSFRFVSLLGPLRGARPARPARCLQLDRLGLGQCGHQRLAGQTIYL